MNTPDTAPNLAALEELLSSLRDLTQAEYPALAQVLSEAVLICQSRHAVHGGLTLQLQGALASIHQGRPDDAARFIEIAIGIQDRWAGRA
jgi:hypothetical protein